MDERRMLKRLCRGDGDALGIVMDTYMPYVYTVASNILSRSMPREDVEEVVSDVFVTLWKNAEAVREGKLKAYLAALTRNAALSKLRSRHLSEPLEENAMPLDLPDPEDRVISLAMADAAREAVNSLPEPDRNIFVRYYYLYQKTDDIAAELGLSPANVRVKLSRGRQKLRAYLEGKGY